MDAGAEAVACSDRALNLAPQQAVFWNNKGRFLAGLGDGRKPSPARSGTDSQPTACSGLEQQGRKPGPLDPTREALACCDQALDIDPELIVAWDNKGANLAGLGRRGEAISATIGRWPSIQKMRWRGTTRGTTWPSWGAWVKRWPATRRRWRSIRSTRMPGSTRRTARMELDARGMQRFNEQFSPGCGVASECAADRVCAIASS